MPDLTPQQERFCREYLADLNGSAAYRRAYPKVKGEKVARTNAARLLANASVAARVAELQAERERRTDVTANRVLTELARLAFLDPGDVLDFTGDVPRFKPPGDIPAAARKCLSKVKVRRYIEGGGDDAREVEVVEFGFWDKRAALELLGRHLGMWKDTVRLEGPPPPDLSTLTESQRAQILAALRPLCAPRPVAGPGA